MTRRKTQELVSQDYLQCRKTALVFSIFIHMWSALVAPLARQSLAFGWCPCAADIQLTAAHPSTGRKGHSGRALPPSVHVQSHGKVCFSEPCLSLPCKELGLASKKIFHFKQNNFSVWDLSSPPYKTSQIRSQTEPWILNSIVSRFKSLLWTRKTLTWIWISHISDECPNH